ncbi:hypothetical protein LWI28_005671 [Acer negundo]|uniref:Uncharacterized protein n=1 Tax=Acer negundo TaxID=4023 RepID=A0AAD5NH43_ACENE|nr:hypothetical protein LWI28_005671 [Acer negundo]
MKRSSAITITVREIPGTSDELPRCLGLDTRTPLRRYLGLSGLGCLPSPRDTGYPDELPQCLRLGTRPPKKGLRIKWPLVAYQVQKILGISDELPRYLGMVRSTVGRTDWDRCWLAGRMAGWSGEAPSTLTPFHGSPLEAFVISSPNSTTIGFDVLPPAPGYFLLLPVGLLLIAVSASPRGTNYSRRVGNAFYAIRTPWAFPFVQGWLGGETEVRHGVEVDEPEGGTNDSKLGSGELSKPRLLPKQASSSTILDKGEDTFGANRGTGLEVVPSLSLPSIGSLALG